MWSARRRCTLNSKDWSSQLSKLGKGHLNEFYYTLASNHYPGLAVWEKQSAT